MKIIKCPIYGEIGLEDWHLKIVQKSEFQRLKGIHQLGVTYLRYPKANHKRFEHSLGVFHLATKMMNTIWENHKEQIGNHFGYGNEEFQRILKIAQAAALLHDIGHPPFSHVTEKLFPVCPVRKRQLTHEDYSIEIILKKFNDVINLENLGITTEEVVEFLTETPKDPKLALWKPVISGTIDADRMDYLQRDAYHLHTLQADFNRDAIIEGQTPIEHNGIMKLGIKLENNHDVGDMLRTRRNMTINHYFSPETAINEKIMLEALQDVGHEHPHLDQLDEFLRLTEKEISQKMLGHEDFKIVYYSDRFLQEEEKAFLQRWNPIIVEIEKSSWFNQQKEGFNVISEQGKVIPFKDKIGLQPYQATTISVRKSLHEEVSKVLISVGREIGLQDGNKIFKWKHEIEEMKKKIHDFAEKPKSQKEIMDQFDLSLNGFNHYVNELTKDKFLQRGSLATVKSHQRVFFVSRTKTCKNPILKDIKLLIPKGGVPVRPNQRNNQSIDPEQGQERNQ